MGKSDQGLISGRGYKTVPRVLIFLRNNSDILLLRGAPDKTIWANLYNGVGGHVNVDEDILSAARREVLEETGLIVDNLGLKAVVNIDAGDSENGIMMFTFVGWADDRTTISSTEGSLHWIPVVQIANYPLVEDLYWLIPEVIDRNSNQSPLFLRYYYDDKDHLVIHPTP